MTAVMRGAPVEYIHEKGSLDLLEQKINERNWRSVLVLRGEKSWHAVEDYINNMSSINFDYVSYQGHCSRGDIELIHRRLPEKTYDGVIGIGGGKLIDMVKAIAHFHSLPYGLIPTLPSSCAPCTSFSHIYTDKGSLERIEVFPQQASFVLVDPDILFHAPIEYLISGIGFTLSKWYETVVLLEHMVNRPPTLETRFLNAQLCKDMILRYGRNAVEDVENEEISNAFLYLVDTIFLTTSMVENNNIPAFRGSGAHFVHQELSLLEETRHLPMGYTVAYSILVQLLMEGKEKIVDELLSLYRKIHLPYSLPDLHLSNISEQELEQLAEQAASKTIIPKEVTPESIIEAILLLESKSLHVIKD